MTTTTRTIKEPNLNWIGNDQVRVAIDATPVGRLGRVEACFGGEWTPITAGEVDDGFFAGDEANVTRTVRRWEEPDGSQCLELTRTDPERGWTAVQTLQIPPDKGTISRRHHYRFDKAWAGAVHPGWLVSGDAMLRYTLPMHAHELPPAKVEPLRADVEWALPLPMHVWHNQRYLAGYGVMKPASAGTLDLHRTGDDLAMRIYYPDRCAEPLSPAEQLLKTIRPPETITFGPGYRLTLEDVLWVEMLQEGQEPLFEATRITAGMLMHQARSPVPAEQSASRLANFFRDCRLWNPDALGIGRGWFRQLWTNTHGNGDASYFDSYDLGWGEGIAAESIPAMVRHARRTGCSDFNHYIDEMSRNFSLFQRRPANDEPYFDRCHWRDGEMQFGDFCTPWRPDPAHSRLIWTHSAGHMGYLLADLALEAADWPNAETVAHWRTLAGNLARYYARLQGTDGDLPDVTDDQDRETHHRPHRIAARVVVAGLWTRWAELSGESDYLDRARRLIDVVAPQIQRYEYLNQMCDALDGPECSDGEAACYALEGLVPYYEATGDVAVGQLCRQAATWVMLWTYYYDLPHAHEGIARGGQCCRMPDYPLLYPIGPAKAMKPFLSLHRLTGDPLYRRMADEMAYFIARNIHHCPGKPWDGGAVHAIDQRTGKYWNSTPCTGQVDTGMSSGNALAALEIWLGTQTTKLMTNSTIELKIDGDGNVLRLQEGEVHRLLTALPESGPWDLDTTVEADGRAGILKRTLTFRLREDARCMIRSGWHLPAARTVRYTYPLYAHEQPPEEQAEIIRADVDWALPFPFHVWHGERWVALYGTDKRVSPGTLEFIPDAAGPILGTCYPDRAAQHKGMSEQWFKPINQPEPRSFTAGETVTLHEIIAVAPVAPGQEPLWEAVRLAADLLLNEPRSAAGMPAAADRQAEYFAHCGLWNPDALGEGRGWFHNMWVYTHKGTPTREWPCPCFDLGWGEGIAVEMITGLRRHWQRTGRADLLGYVDEVSRNIECFKRDTGDASPYFDRSNGERYGDFFVAHCPELPLNGRRIWTHSTGHVGYHLITNYLEAPDYPNARTREAWLTAAGNIARYYARIQQSDGDLPDITDDADREANPKPHRIAARLVVAGLWVRYGQVMDEPAWAERALRLARAVGPEIARGEYFNQMVDSFSHPDVECQDGEAACYVLEGLAPLYAVTHDPYVGSLCRQAAAFAMLWTYFYDVPNAYRGVARGGQCCRMPDFPLVYPIGPAKAIEPFLILATEMDDPLYRRMADEMAYFVSRYQHDCPGKPWDHGAVHAIDQRTGAFWSLDESGQVDSGMSSGNALAALEIWMARNGTAQ